MFVPDGACAHRVAWWNYPSGRFQRRQLCSLFPPSCRCPARWEEGSRIYDQAPDGPLQVHAVCLFGLIMVIGTDCVFSVCTLTRRSFLRRLSPIPWPTWILLLLKNLLPNGFVRSYCLDITHLILHTFTVFFGSLIPLSVSSLIVSHHSYWVVS